MKLKVKLVTFTFCSILLAESGIAIADYDGGWYLGASVNRLGADQREVNDLDFNHSDNAFGFKTGYMFSDRWGVEVGFIDLGNYRTGTDARGIARKLNAEAYTLTGIYNLQLSEKWDAYGKVGAAILNAETDLQIEESDTQFYGGAGLELDLGHFNIFGEFSIIDTDINKLQVDVLSAGFKFEF